MTARDELADLLWEDAASDRVREDKVPRLTPIVRLKVEAAADKIIAAGYRKPRTITTAEELDALPDAVLILTEQGGYWESIKRMDLKNWWKEPGATSVVASEDLTLPATVLHEGAQP